MKTYSPSIFNILLILALICQSLMSSGQSNENNPGTSDSLQADTSLPAGGDSLKLSGQALLWALVNDAEDFPLWLGARYLPQLNYEKGLMGNGKIDFEIALNFNGTSSINPFSDFNFESNLKLYRTWARYSNNQLEIRLGLQKINFGSATMLRPLMWFDRLDPRDPLQLTDGVWGLLCRYYFLNNVNLWVWGLYGNERPSVWEVVKTNEQVPEFGGRIQMPVPRGEVAFSFHKRAADIKYLGDLLQVHGWNDSRVPEYKFGLDGKWDLITGLWFEASYTKKGQDVDIFTNQHLLNVGVDYTFGIGNGLNVVGEHLYISQDAKPFDLSNSTNFSGLSVNYPLGIDDNLNTILYYDWLRKNIYSFISWKKQIGNFGFYTMVFINPDINVLPLSRDANNLMGGKGLQVMIVYNH